MKKTLFGVMLLLAVTVGQVSAQNVSGGIKAEANLSNFLLNKDISGTSRMGFGATLGGFAKVDFTENFALQPEILFHFHSSDYKLQGMKRNFEYWGMEIPVYAMGQWAVANNDRFYVGVGPYVGLGFQARYDKPELKLYDEDALHRWDFGFKALVGYEFSNRIQINATYKIGVINAVNEGVGEMRPEVVSLGLGYRF